MPISLFVSMLPRLKVKQYETCPCLVFKMKNKFSYVPSEVWSQNLVWNQAIYPHGFLISRSLAQPVKYSINISTKSDETGTSSAKLRYTLTRKRTTMQIEIHIKDQITCLSTSSKQHSVQAQDYHSLVLRADTYAMHLKCLSWPSPQANVAKAYTVIWYQLKVTTYIFFWRREVGIKYIPVFCCIHFSFSFLVFWR